MAFTQGNTNLQITTPFGADAVLLARFHGEERLSALFRFDLDLVSQERELAFKTILGQGVTVKITLAAGKARFFHGIVTRFVQAGRTGKLTSYRAEVHPRLWLLGKTRESRIFQKKAVPEIIKEIFSAHGVTPVEDKLKGTYAKREYCVQYQESDLEFVSRLMEDEGIHYFFKHEDGKHTLVLGDDSTAHPPCPNLATARYRGDVASNTADEDVISSLEIEEQVVAGSYAQGDYNFEMPQTSLLASVDGADASLKVFEYPGNHAAKGEGEERAKLRLEAEEALAHRIVGGSYCRAMTAGHTFALTEHERGDVNDDYVVAHVVHAATGQVYSNTFEAALKKTPQRPARITPRPIIHGAQTAVVTGKSGEEIWTDKYGRIKVQFHWDRLGKKDEQSSCWVRVSQGWAGKGWGAFFLPRVGQEVIVSFLGGDPDRPLITGSVYNAEQTVPYALPDAQTQSTVKSRSSKGGSAGNELRFEDKKDSEEVLLHAEKDLNFTIKNDFTTAVDHDAIVNVKNDRTTSIAEGNESLTVVKGNRLVDVQKGDETHQVKGKREVSVDGELTHTTKGDVTHNAKKGYTLKIDGDLTIDVKGAIKIKGGTSIGIKAGTDAKIEAGTEIMNKAGTSLTNKAGTSLTNDAGVSLTNKAAASQTVDGGGMLTLKGGLVKIN
jgi:type VI secretion system secreted protein VgrG